MKSLKSLAKTALIAGAVSLALSGCGYFEKFFIPECNFVKTIEMTAASANGYPESKYELQGNFVNILKFPTGNNFAVRFEYGSLSNARIELRAKNMKFKDDKDNLCYLSYGKLYNPGKSF